MAIDVEQVSQEYFTRIHRAALVLTGNPWDADDLAQETFLVVTSKGHGFQGRSSTYTYLYGILLNLERRHRRRAGMQKRKLRVLWDNEPRERSVPAAETAIEVSEWKSSLWAVVARLPDGQRQRPLPRFTAHVRHAATTEALEGPVGTVKSRIFNGLTTLRELMGEGASHGAGEVPRHAWEDLTHAI